MTVSHPGPMNIMEEKARECRSWRMGKGCCKILYYGCFVAIALRNSKQPSLHEEDLHMIDLVSLPACPGEKLVWFHPCVGAIGNWWLLGESLFLKSDRFPMLQQMASHINQIVNSYNFLFLKKAWKQKREAFKGGLSWSGRRKFGLDMSMIYYVHTKLSKNK